MKHETAKRPLSTDALYTKLSLLLWLLFLGIVGCATSRPPHPQAPSPTLEPSPTIVPTPRKLVVLIETTSAEQTAWVERIEEAAQIGSERAAMWGAFHRPVRLRLYDSQEELNQAHGKGRRIDGFTRKDTIHILSPHLYPKIARNLPILMAHELTHEILWQMADKGDVPKWRLPSWFGEGMSVYTAGQAIWSTRQIRELLQAHPAEDVLTSDFARKPGMARVPYRVGGALVACLVERYGLSRLRETMVAFERGKDFPTNFRRAYGLSVADLAKQVFQEITSGGTCPARPDDRPKLPTWPLPGPTIPPTDDEPPEHDGTDLPEGTVETS